MNQSLAGKILLESTPTSLDQVESIVQGYASECCVSDDRYMNIVVTLTEAIANAIFHGNQGDRTKHVGVEVLRKHSGICFRVSDEGPGFDFQNLPDPTRDENLLKANGRGVFIMKHLSDEVIYSGNGNTVELFFHV